MLKILHFSSHFEDCGIAKYQENYLEAMGELDDLENTFFDHSPYQTRDMKEQEFDKVLDELKAKLQSYDILHIQHEFGFFRGNQLAKLVTTAKETQTKVVVTYHTSPDLIIIRKGLSGLGPRSIISYLRSYRHNKKLMDIHIAPLNNSDAVIAHNKYTLDQLSNYGVNRKLIHLLPHPTYNITNPPKTTFIADSLDKKPGDVILSTLGYIHRFKGVDKAIKALSYLPANYKLAVLGGVKSDSDDQALYDEIADLILERGLENRVFITGVIPSDQDMNSYIRETDISLYPYDSKYYKGVSSGALNLAIANERPVIAYPVSTLEETSEKYDQLVFTQSDSYYELARAIKDIDIKKQVSKIKEYAHSNSWPVITNDLVEIYRDL